MHDTLWEEHRVLLPHGGPGWGRQRVSVAWFVSEQDLSKLLGGLRALVSRH
jgi:hypothetical protein